MVTRNELFLGGLGDNRVLFAIDVQHGKDIKLYSVYAAPTSAHNQLGGYRLGGVG